MHVAHSQLREEPVLIKRPKPKRSSWAAQHAYRQYQKVLVARAADIEEIQKYFPGWVPEFEY